MKKRLYIGFVSAALFTAPLTASAFMCSPGKGYSKHGYGHPHHARYMYPPAGYHHHHAARMAMAGEERYPHSGASYRSGKAERGESGGSAVLTGFDVEDDLVDTAVSAGNFKTLIDAINKAGLSETLRGEGPYTVFAPTDEAFARIPPSVLAAIVADEEALGEVLANHVVPGIVTSDDVARISKAETVRGGTLLIDTSDGIRVDGANVVTADIKASNGIIHVVDTVMLPN